MKFNLSDSFDFTIGTNVSWEVYQLNLILKRIVKI